MNLDGRREQIYDIVYREFVGPDPINKDGMIQENGEEILISDSPLMRYSAGVLFPSGLLIDEIANADTVEPIIQKPVDDSTEPAKIAEPKDIGAKEWLSETEEIMNLSNSFRQSAISMTVSIKPERAVYVAASCGRYITQINKHLRIPILWTNDSKPLDFPDESNRTKIYPVIIEGEKTELEFVITFREFDAQSLACLFTFSLVNRIKIDEPKRSGNFNNKDCFFQASFRLKCEEGFSALPENAKLNFNDEDYQSNRLLYRELRNFAIGHGCSTDWVNMFGRIVCISTEILPMFEIKSTLPSTIDNVSLDMFKMSDLGSFTDTVSELEQLCASYNSWIIGNENRIFSLPEDFVLTAKRHMDICRSCHQRMLDGIQLLKNDEKVRKAFQLMNRAMLLQQLHYNLPKREWIESNQGILELVNADMTMPSITDRNTWYDESRIIYGKWRPFQLAFILINLRSMGDRMSSDRSLVDVIWFPTGGGKTEAYLGLSAFSIFIRRLLNPNDSGTTILMRYTLRLLSAQQYDRASAMICACESIRKEMEHELGHEHIRIGMWVGGDTTPNKNKGDKGALAKYRNLKKGSTEEYPFVVLKCPWCGAAIGPKKIRRNQEVRIQGIESSRSCVSFICSNKGCQFSSENSPLPMTVIDEEIYENPPTLIIGTVDKFAMLPYLPQAQTIFGIRNGVKGTPPDLIIQDELHLISGPLGSMVGHYETLINELCLDRRNIKAIGPKIIASTATISRAKEQCSALYDKSRDEIVQFPPSGLDAGDTFFSYIEQEKPGRLYVGLMATAASSYSTANIRLYASLLFAAKELQVNKESERDPYWTNLGYFNSLRELGQTSTWVSADISEYLHYIYLRSKADKDPGYKEKRRYIQSLEELTSRISGDQIPATLSRLGIRYPSINENAIPIDICLATNMISVGVDIPRLGLMTVTGQPKTTAEYIQATSRIGRDTNAPGIVFVSYSPGKPRDRSHYEHFNSYHARIYSHVEPTSVTPFSAPLRKRALHAILIGLIRLNGNENTYDDPQQIPFVTELDRYRDLIIDRVNHVDSGEVAATSQQLKKIVESWKRWLPVIYDDFHQGDQLPLMIPAGYRRLADWGDRGFETPMSMRSTDATCEVQVISGYSIGGEDDAET